ncbi:MAG: hypothetical protein ACI3XT_02910 [Butyricicoccaceae bacterium]
MKKSVFAWMLVLSCLLTLLAACGSEPKLTELPTPDEIRAYNESHSETQNEAYARQVVTLLSAMDNAEMYGALESAFLDWAGSQTDPVLSEAGIECRQLMKMNELHDQKWFRQIAVTARVSYDPAALDDEAEALDRIFQSAVDALENTTVGYYKLAQFDLDFYAEGSDTPRNHRNLELLVNGGDFSAFYDSIDWQPAGERAAQTMAYTCAEQINADFFADAAVGSQQRPAFVLTYFGITETDPMLYIGMASADVPADPAQFEAELDQRCSELADALMKDSETVEYMQSGGADTIVIEVGLEGWAEGGYCYTFYLN